MRTVRVHASKDYDVHIGSGIIKDAGDLLAKDVLPCKVAILTDDHVAPLYLQQAEKSFKSAGYDAFPMILAPGETTKSMPVLEDILDFLCRCSMTKSDVVVALGGGVIGDVAGFAAASYLRGVPYIQLPTTFLAAIDSSVGGKTAVNLKAGKNLAGAFWQPNLVICDTDTFKTLNREVYADGISEAVKYGMIGSRALFDTLKRGLKEEQIEDIAVQCVAMKADFVEQDEFDEGKRQMLNFGHTIGHAIEACSDYGISHGHAVGVGMVMMSRAAHRCGLSKEDCTAALIEALEANGLPNRCDFTASQLADAAMGDKKRRGGSITIILPETIGSCYRYKLNVSDLEDFIREGL